MKLSAADQKKLLPHLRRTTEAIEEILTSGLTTANEGTCQTFGVTFQEVSSMKLLRLGSTLRNTYEEVRRYVKDDPRFSQTRLMFFLNRSWLLCRGIEKAVDDKDAPQLEKLLWTAPAKKVKSLSVVCLGVVKKIAAGSFCAFDFRLRDVKTGRPLNWSTVFPMKADTEIPAEGYLHMPQKQKFKAGVFLERQVVNITDAAITEADDASAVIRLTDDSKVTAADPFEDWEQFLTWEADAAVRRIQQHDISPFDVETELQEEVVFGDYQLGKEDTSETDRIVFPLTYRNTEFDLTVSSSLEGKSAVKELKAAGKKKSCSALYGLMHYAACRLVVQPLTLFTNNKPEYITISDSSVDRKALLSALRFT